MNVKIMDAGSCRKVLEIEVPADEVKRERSGLVGEFQKLAHIPGFRVGNAPKDLVAKKFSKQIDEELQKKLIPQSFREAIAKEKLRPVSYPELSDIELKDDKPLSFKATIEVVPEFKLPEYKGIEVKRQKVEVSEEQIEESLTMLREQQSDFGEVTGRELKLGDYAILTYKGVIDGKPIAEISPSAKVLGENQNFWLMMAKDSFVPGFCEQLVGAGIGDKRQVNVEFPNAFFNKDVVGKKASYEVEVNGIREKKLPELNDEFAKSLNMDSVEKLRQTVLENLTSSRTRQAGSDEKNQIVEFLLKQVDLDLPEGVVQEQTRRNIFDMVRENQMRGVSEDDLKSKKDEIFKFANQSAKDHVKAGFILGNIAEKENIKVEHSEVDERITAIAQANQVSIEKMHKDLESNGGMASLQEQILISKTLDFLLANAKVREVEPEKEKK